MERLVFAAKGFTSFDWAKALWAGDHRRRQLYLSRDYRWATRQARIGEFEAAWSQRTKDARAAHRMACEAQAMLDAATAFCEAA